MIVELNKEEVQAIIDGLIFNKRAIIKTLKKDDIKQVKDKLKKEYKICESLLRLFFYKEDLKK